MNYEAYCYMTNTLFSILKNVIWSNRLQPDIVKNIALFLEKQHFSNRSEEKTNFIKTCSKKKHTD